MFKLRDAKKGDESEIARINIFCWQDSFSEFMPTDILKSHALSYENRKEFWKKCLEQQPKIVRIILATLDTGETIGFQYFSLFKGDGANYPEMIGLNVLKQYQNLGAGKLLFGHGLNCLFDSGYDAAIGWVLEENHHARRFFEKIGGVYYTAGARKILNKYFNQICYIWNKPAKSNI